MESQIKKLTRISKWTGIKSGYFYSITVESGSINMQGYFKPELVRYLKKLKFRTEIDTNGYFLLYRGIITITLT